MTAFPPSVTGQLWDRRLLLLGMALAPWIHVAAKSLKFQNMLFVRGTRFSRPFVGRWAPTALETSKRALCQPVRSPCLLPLTALGQSGEEAGQQKRGCSRPSSFCSRLCRCCPLSWALSCPPLPTHPPFMFKLNRLWLRKALQTLGLPECGQQ